MQEKSTSYRQVTSYDSHNSNLRIRRTCQGEGSLLYIIITSMLYIVYIAEETESLQWMEITTSISDATEEHQTDSNIDNCNTVDDGTEFFLKSENTEEHQTIEGHCFNGVVSLPKIANLLTKFNSLFQM